MTDTRGEHVALVHGYLANRFVFTLLGSRLRRRGFRPRPWGYWNMGCSLLVHADRFAGWLTRIDNDPSVTRIHLVGHSMGCIVSRAALDRYRPRKLGRFVMLAPPNRGSFVATAAAPTFGRFLRPVAELATGADSLVNLLPTPQGVEIGVIAAAYDALVAEESTHPDAPHDHVTLATWHTGLLFHRETANLVSGFLTDGHFPAPTTPAPHRQRAESTGS